MCWCTPELRTPCCGRPECKSPGVKSDHERISALTVLNVNVGVMHGGYTATSPDYKGFFVTSRTLEALYKVVIPCTIEAFRKNGLMLPHKFDMVFHGTVFDHQKEKDMGNDFGWAIQQLKMGKKVCRTGWNGKGMWLAYSPGAADLHYKSFWAPPNQEFAKVQPDHCAKVLPCITMKTANDEILMGWLASQTDMLAEDWEIAT